MPQDDAKQPRPEPAGLGDLKALPPPSEEQARRTLTAWAKKRLLTETDHWSGPLTICDESILRVVVKRLTEKRYEQRESRPISWRRPDLPMYSGSIDAIQIPEPVTFAASEHTFIRDGTDTQEPCHCHGGRVACTRCKGHGMVRCSQCGGSGQSVSQRHVNGRLERVILNCTYCASSGRVVCRARGCQAGQVICSRCDGQGMTASVTVGTVVRDLKAESKSDDGPLEIRKAVRAAAASEWISIYSSPGDEVPRGLSGSLEDFFAAQAGGMEIGEKLKRVDVEMMPAYRVQRADGSKTDRTWIIGVSGTKIVAKGALKTARIIFACLVAVAVAAALLFATNAFGGEATRHDSQGDRDHATVVETTKTDSNPNLIPLAVSNRIRDELQRRVSRKLGKRGVQLTAFTCSETGAYKIGERMHCVASVDSVKVLLSGTWTGTPSQPRIVMSPD